MTFPPTYALTIDAKSGAIQLEGFAVALERQMPVEAVQHGFASFIERAWDHQNGYAWLALGGRLRFAEMPASLALCFFEGRLTMVTLGVTLPDDEEEAGWPTEQTSLRQVGFLRRALAKRLGKPMDEGGASFPSGDVWARFDLKGFMASAGVRYRDAPPGGDGVDSRE